MDIVERLRKRKLGITVEQDRELRETAADEIERLRAALMAIATFVDNNARSALEQKRDT